MGHPARDTGLGAGRRSLLEYLPGPLEGLDAEGQFWQGVSFFKGYREGEKPLKFTAARPRRTEGWCDDADHGNLDKPVAHFQDALAFCRKAGYRPELTWFCCDYRNLLPLPKVVRTVKSR